jgi:hypothetical protein
MPELAIYNTNTGVKASQDLPRPITERCKDIERKRERLGVYTRLKSDRCGSSFGSRWDCGCNAGRGAYTSETCECLGHSGNRCICGRRLTRRTYIQCVSASTCLQQIFVHLSSVVQDIENRMSICADHLVHWQLWTAHS